MYLIGLFNNLVDNPDSLDMCNIKFDDFNDLKNHIRHNDMVILSSAFSLYDIDIQEILSVKEDYKVKFILSSDYMEDNFYINDASNELNISLISAIMCYIQKEKEIVLKLLSK